MLNKRIERITLHPDGHEFPIEITKWANYTATQSYQFYAFIHDISLHKQAEEAIKTLKQQLEQRVNTRKEELLNAKLTYWLSHMLVTIIAADTTSIAKALPFFASSPNASSGDYSLFRGYLF